MSFLGALVFQGHILLRPSFKKMFAVTLLIIFQQGRLGRYTEQNKLSPILFFSIDLNA